MSRAAPVSGFSPLTPPNRRLRPDDYLIRATAATFIKASRDNWEAPQHLAQDLWPGDDQTQLLLKAASSPATLGDPAWAGSYASQAVASFIASLPNSVFAALRRASPFGDLTMPRAASLSIPSLSDIPAASFIAELAAIPVLQGHLTAARLGHRKVSAIACYTRELANVPGNAEAMIRVLLGASVTKGVDQILLSANAATPAAPAGIFNGVTPITASTSIDPQTALREDVAALVGELADDASDNLLLVANKVQAAALRMAFPAGGISVVSSSLMPAGSVALIDAQAFASVASGAPSYDLSEAAMLQLRTDPSPDALTQPPVASAWQAALIAVRIILDLDWSMTAPGHVALVENVAW